MTKRKDPSRPPRRSPASHQYTDRSAERMVLYLQGLSDAEIGKRQCAHRNAVLAWRKARGLAPNIPQGRFERPGMAVRHLLYTLGWNDCQIARQQRVGANCIWRWRTRRTLPANAEPGARSRGRAPNLDDVVRRIRAAVGRALPRDIAEDAVADMCEAILVGKLPLADLEREARRYGNRVLDRFASRYGARSLDEELGDEDGFRMIDMIRDERSSSWLEEMGATMW